MDTPLPLDPGSIASTVATQTSVSQVAPPRGWLDTNLRPVILMVLTGIVCWLALTGNQTAISTLMGTYGALVGATWGSRDALHIPGKDGATG